MTGSNMTPKIILIRHGESLGNCQGHYYEHKDCVNILSQQGVDQCIALQKHIGDYVPYDKFDTHTTVIASKHIRAQLTANIAMQAYNYPILIDARLNECYHLDDGKGNYLNIEPRSSVLKRIRALLNQHEFTLVLFCHGVLMQQLDPLKGDHVENCEVRVYDRSDFEKLLEIK